MIVSGKSIDSLGVFFCLCAAVVNGFAFLSLRKLKNVPATYSVLSYSFSVMIGSLVVGLAFDYGEWKGVDLSNYYDLTLLLAIGAFGFVGQFLKTKSCQYIEGGVGSIVRSTDVLWAYSWQIIFFDAIPTLLTLVGALCVVFPVILISTVKIRDSYKQRKSLMMPLRVRVTE